MTAGLVLPMLAAALFVSLSVAGFVAARREPGPTITLAGVGRVSPATLFVAALACFGVAYHIVVYAFELKQFRAPWWVAVAVAAGAVLMSLGVDAVENRRQP